jgi:quercetin 2,3-dioxygenase
MHIIRRAEDRGTAKLAWLDSRHTFSFGDYHDPRYMGFGSLRVINEDRVQPGQGFGTHGHQDMEIISYVLAGALEHRDSMGTGSIIRPGEVQRMTAGTGVRHSEHNPSESELVHFLQIWIIPESKGLAPSYEQKALPLADSRGALRLIGSRDGREGSVTIHQDVELWAASLAPADTLAHEIPHGRKGWLQVARGRVELDGGETLDSGDGLALRGPHAVRLRAASDAEVLLFIL